MKKKSSVFLRIFCLILCFAAILSSLSCAFATGEADTAAVSEQAEGTMSEQTTAASEATKSDESDIALVSEEADTATVSEQAEGTISEQTTATSEATGSEESDIALVSEEADTATTSDTTGSDESGIALMSEEAEPEAVSSEASTETVETTPAHWYKTDDAWYYYDAGDVLHTGWLELDGSRYYFDLSTGIALTGWQEIDGNTYFFRTSARAACTGVWTISGVKYGFDDNGVMLRDAWGMDSQGNHYYFGSDGVPLTGWQDIDGEIYFFRTSAKCACTGVWNISGTKYCFDESGALQRSMLSTDSSGNIYYTDANGTPATGWQEIDGNTYFFRRTAKCACTGLWSIDGVYYYFDETTGVLQRSTLITSSSGKIYYLDANGTPVTGWQDIDGNTYFFRRSAKCACTGVWNISGTKYYFDGNGVLQRSKWSTDSAGNIYYVDANGTPATGWMTIDGNTYFFRTTAKCACTGVWTIGGVKYGFDSNGVMLRNAWGTDSQGRRYYFGEDGAALTGWQEIDGETYFFRTSAKCACTGVWNIAGTKYYFDEYGALLHSQWSVGADGNTYYVYENGVPASGWTVIDGETYYFGTSSRKLYKGLTSIGGYFYYLDDTTGVLQYSGWHTDSAGNRYYLQDNGVALTGWQSLNGTWYYFSTDTAAMAVGWNMIGDSIYYFYEDGTLATSTTVDGKTIGSNGKVSEGDGSALTAEDKMNLAAQGYASSTGYLMMTDVDNCKVGVFTGSRGNWTLLYYWDCTPGKSSTPTPEGVFSLGKRYYSFGNSNYTAYYGSTFYTETGTEWLFHSTLYQVDGYSTRDGRLGYHGSNGCIRLLTSNAKWVYENVPNGTTVVNY